MAQGDAPAKEIAAGTAAELREEPREGLKAYDNGPDASNQSVVRLNEVLERLQELLTAQIRTELQPGQPGTAVDQAWKILEGLSPEAKALAFGLSQGHLTRIEYKKLFAGPLSPALNELRLAGILVPLDGVDKTGHDIPVYWFPSRLADAVRTAISLTTLPPAEIRNRIKVELERIGYRDDRRADS